nr:PREDICTED: bromo adjacent homology domain-containing 1 protein isoform X2 [Latimeria chalumnae]|eukprot:XP_014340941.1 PREDICTED: bromo adjacent homology domain-containing 1 protein isoform X2 [Latimeria chalumnae]
MTHARKRQALLLKHQINSTEHSCASWLNGQTMEGLHSGGNGVRTTAVPNCRNDDFDANRKDKTESPLEIRKLYPLRKRPKQENRKACSVLLTRLEDVAGGLEDNTQSCPKLGTSSWQGRFANSHCAGKCRTLDAGKGKRVGRDPQPTCSGMAQECESNPSEPRKRRLASLNAEALNNVLLERDEGNQAKRLRKDFAKANGDCSSGDLHGKGVRSRSSCETQESKVFGNKPRNTSKPRTSSSNHSLEDDVFDDGVSVCKSSKGEGHLGNGDPNGQPMPKRLASLNAAVLLKLASEKHCSTKQRSKSDGDGKVNSSKPRLKWTLSDHENCVETSKDVLSTRTEEHYGLSGEPEGTLKYEAPDPSELLIGNGSLKNERLPHCHDDTEAYLHRLSLVMDRRGLAKPEYQKPGERSPTPKREFLHPSISFQQQCSASPRLGNVLACSYHFGSSEFPPANGYYFHYGQNGFPGDGYPQPHCSLFPGRGFSHCSQPVAHEGLLVSQSVLSSDGFNSLEQHSLTIPMAGHPVAPAHPLSGCPVPSVPPAAEPVPHLQIPNSEPQEQQTFSLLKVARECPQSSKPPSGSRSGVRNTAGCFHALSSKSSSGHPHVKQQRIHRRRATNGWLPVGVSFEKAVYVVGKQEPTTRKCYQAVERDGEIIRVRDTVLLKSGPRKKSLPYVAKISALWEDPTTGELMMSLFWYYRAEHIQGGRSPSMHQNEIFASRHQDENSVACIEEKCFVLTFAEYCRFCALVKRRDEGILNNAATMVPPSEEYATPQHRSVPVDIDPDQVFLCRHVYDFRHGRILKNPQ